MKQFGGEHFNIGMKVRPIAISRKTPGCAPVLKTLNGLSCWSLTFECRTHSWALSAPHHPYTKYVCKPTSHSVPSFPRFGGERFNVLLGLQPAAACRFRAGLRVREVTAVASQDRASVKTEGRVYGHTHGMLVAPRLPYTKTNHEHTNSSLGESPDCGLNVSAISADVYYHTGWGFSSPSRRSQ